MTRLQTLRDAILTELNVSNRPVEFTKRRWNSDSALEEDEIRAAVLFHREIPRLVGGSVTQRDNQIAVQVVTATAEPDEIDDALEDARDWMVSRLGNTNLGGLVQELEEGPTTWETATIERVHGAFITLWSATYQTHRADLTQPH